MRAQLVFVSLAVLGACSLEVTPQPEPGDVDGGDTLGGDPDGGDAAGGDPDTGPEDCPRALAAADRVRTVIVSHPYDVNADPANVYAVWSLSTGGVLSSTGATFTMGQAIDAPAITFTPDGEIGIVVQKNGTLGIFRVTGSGVQVIDGGYNAGEAFYADSVLLDETGQWLYVLDNSWRIYEGGIHLVHLGCDDTPEYLGKLVEAKLPSGVAWLPKASGAAQSAIVVAHDIGDSPVDQDAHRISLAATAMGAPTVVTSADIDDDADAIFSSLAVSQGGTFGLISDNGMFATKSVSSFAIGQSSLTPLQTFTHATDNTALGDLATLVMSPYDNAALLVSAYDPDALYRMSFDATDALTPFGAPAKLAYSGGAPELPVAATVIAQGSLTGLVLIAENLGVRRVRFETNGTITDLGRTSAGSGMTAIVGTVGVQP